MKKKHLKSGTLHGKFVKHPCILENLGRLGELHWENAFVFPNPKSDNIVSIVTVFMQKNFPPKNIPNIRICLPHVHALTICLRHLVASVLTKFEVLREETCKVLRGLCSLISLMLLGKHAKLY